ncbi:MAG: hypothetical protein KGH94_01810 [Candidatus Micrarchaeota archaeon]|nr:hypothetical protein [Candidatus Micrarchaeota archaeon]
MATRSGSWDELAAEAKKSGKSKIHELLEPKLRGFQERLRTHEGELVAVKALSPTNDLYDYLLIKTVNVGIITPKTTFPVTEQAVKDSHLGTIMLNVKNPVEVFLDEGYPKFINGKETIYNHRLLDFVVALYFHDRQAGEFNSEPRLKFFIGNGEAVPFLASELKGYQYAGLSKVLQVELPMGPTVTAKMNDEKIELYRDVIKAEGAFENYDKWLSARIGRANASKGQKISTQPQMPTDDLHDEVSLRLNFGPELNERERTLMRNVELGIARGYHKEHGVIIEINEDAGVKRTLDVGKFFYDRMLRYELTEFVKA